MVPANDADIVSAAGAALSFTEPAPTVPGVRACRVAC
jgi:hypothetical protein